MKAAKFDYARPTTLEEATQSLSKSPATSKLMGGSQSLGPMLNLRLTRPQSVVDVSAIASLREVTLLPGNIIRIGSAVTHAEIEDGVHPLLRTGLMQTVAAGIAYRAIRNRGTIGGSLAHADPAADWVLCMSTLGAQIEAKSPRGTRMIAISQFMHGAYTTDLKDDEIIVSVQVPQLNHSAHWGYAKLCRKPGEFAEASCCAVFDPTRSFARIVIGALDGPPRALPSLAMEVAATGLMPTAEEISSEVLAVAPNKDAIDRKLFTTTVKRCLQQVLARETST